MAGKLTGFTPLTGLRCINWYAGCDMATSLILPQTTDASGFYGATVTSGGAKWMHGMMSDAFYQYLQQMPVGGSFYDDHQCLSDLGELRCQQRRAL